MTAAPFRIMPMKAAHVAGCRAIVAGSDPWKRLGEGIDFRSVLRPNRTNTRAYVCLAGGRTAGFVLFAPEPVFARGGYLRAIAVAPGFRGQGIGKKLLAFAEEMTSRRSRHLFLCVSSFNRKARAFYQKCGYEKAGVLRELITPGVSEVLLWKKLKQKK